ncbi:CLUMA_CG019975, isoform A [Clunio marinus]|uniref:CLUMA_CG019975, isoform A n=1 Tax=Clunio marinus TaxID=568069 RepID=A0A1J1J3M9_9DIPT|nr:CLUMA_CG019975, isoform A [Clunio marinus]
MKVVKRKIKTNKKDHNNGWTIEETSAGPSKKMVKLLSWSESDIISNDETEEKTCCLSINKNLILPTFAQDFSKSFKNTQKFSRNFVELKNKPFQVAVVEHFLDDKFFITGLVNEIENIEWTRKQMDLYEFYQSTDLANIENEYLATFFKFLNTDVRLWMQELTGMKFKKISASCSMYNNGDFLLAHDDLLSDRLIAYVFYLSPWENKEKWNDSMGGALELFETDDDGQPKFPVSQKIFPANNQLVFFKVERKSFHQKQIEENSEAALGDFLISDVHSNVLQELESKELRWITKGPAHQQNYEYLNIENLGKNSQIKRLCNVFSSEFMFKLLHEYTELDLYGKKATNPNYVIEIQRWKGGNYKLIGDPSTFNNDTLDLILYFGRNDNVGTITYLTPDEDETDDHTSIDSSHDDEPVLLTIYPQNNFLNIIYRSAGTAKFTKYCSKSTITENFILNIYNKMEESSNKSKDEFSRILSTISYIVVIFIIGIPMWWKTTEIHRASLPSNEILSLDVTPITFTMNIAVFISNDDKRRRTVDDLQSLFDTNDIFKANISGLNIESSQTANIKTPAKLEQMIMMHYKVKPGNLLLIEWKNLEEDVLVTSDRTVFISENVAIDRIYHVIRTWIVRDYKIRSILGQVMTLDGKQLRHNVPPPPPEYEVLISVLNPRPDLQTLHWNIKKASDQYLKPFLNEFNELSQFTLKSQRKYQVELKYGSQQIKDETKIGRHFALDHETLPHIITSIERKLGTDVVNKPCVHLVIYSPPCQMAPVYIYKNGQRVSNFTYDSFISAKWGGIVIVNPSENACISPQDDEPRNIYLHSHEVMDFVLYQLRKIFDLEIEIPLPSSSIVGLDQVKPRIWERDMILRNGAIHLIASASSTIKSLIKLLDDIKNIVIGDHVASEIHQAYENVVIAKELLSVNEIHEAVKHARKAFIAAEKAFNDPSLLELLYFPEEQKYAIYIPLYLPIMIPVVFSISAVRKYFKKNKQKEAPAIENESEEKLIEEPKD